MTGKQRPFAHLPRAVDEPAQVRALLDAVGADWGFLARVVHMLRRAWRRVR